MSPVANGLWARSWDRVSHQLGEEWASYGRLYAARLVGVVAGMVLAVFSARALRPQGRGEFAALATATLVTAQILNLGLSSSLVVLFSRRPRRITRYRPYLYVLPGLSMLLLAVAGAGIWLLAPSAVYLLVWWPFCTIWIPLQLLGLHQAAALLATLGSKPLARIELTGRVTSVCLAGLSLLLFPASLPWFVGALIAADALVAFLGARHLARAFPLVTARSRHPTAFFKAALRLGFRAYPLLFLPFLLVKSDILLMRAFRGSGETGVYSIASQIIDIAQILPITIAAVALPSIVRHANPKQALLRLLRPTFALVLSLVVALVAFGYWGIVWIFGHAYADAYPALLLLLPGFVCLALQGLLSQYFGARGFPVVLSLYWFLGLAVNVSLNFILLPRFGLLAASVTSSLSYALVFGLSARLFVQERSGGDVLLRKRG
ncbi:MAG TPA: polysaccharide biosynthesis C-terminal domain-containing protein [Vicinamibacteria bacterium]|jgi:O-antigen/teichoic acid export membrane protein|nr:polysaccharide biosynthesis C-terminal domain-containing protein [Vicinamibacteria bacterium]